VCGIAGYRGPQPIDASRIEACLSLMHRRGPDFATHREWRAADTTTQLLFTRLSIIDLDPRANQPLACGTQWMTCNGELYNYKELRHELERAGHTFKTQSDVEVFVHWLDHHGLEGLDRCEGMWAFALYDESTGTLTLCRDRFAEKPLYVYRDATGLYFGSEVKFLSALLGRKLDVNIEHLRRYLVNGFKSLYKSDQTFFQGVREGPAGTYLILADDGEQAGRYWQLRFAPDTGMTYADAVDAARAELVRSVELRLRSDVPLAFCLSGGVDSNSLVSIAKNVFDYDVHGFTIVNDDARYDEREMVQHSVAELSIRHTAISADRSNFLPRLRALVRQHDAPVYTISYYAHYMLMEGMAQHGYRIAVSGTGADELFTGYYDHHLAYLYEVRNTPSWQASRDAWTEQIRPFVRNPFLSRPDLFIDDPSFRDHIFLDADAFSAMLAAPFREPFSESPLSDSLLRNRMLNELLHEIVPVILHEDDLNAMYYSIENRSPFLDRGLAELCYQIPSPLLMRNGRAKAVLRDAMRGIVADRILDCPEKIGFNAPIFSYLDVDDPEVRDSLLAPSPIFDHVRQEAIQSLLDERELPNSRSKFLFYFLSAKLFLEEFA